MTETNWVLLARIVRTQGRRGELLADLFTDFPQHFAARQGLFLRPPSESPRGALLKAANAAPGADMTAVTIDAHWLHKGRIVLKFSHIDSMNDAEKLRGFEVVVAPEHRVPLEDDAVYVSDLVGCRVIDVNLGQSLDAGEITDVEPEGAGPAMLVVRTPAHEEFLIPFVRAYLKKVDLQGKRLEMELPQGLLAMQAPAIRDEPT